MTKTNSLNVLAQITNNNFFYGKKDKNVVRVGTNHNKKIQNFSMKGQGQKYGVC